MFALIDCNNFYVSCERLFRPGLRRRPVAVLSNNDGCIVSRSAEVKAMGIPMGAPLFEVRDRLAAEGAVLFSSNYALYGDLSARVMHTIASLSSEVEVYSIDEAFVCLAGLEPGGWEGHGRKLRMEVSRRTGIPVSVGMAATKTLAKLASKAAKKGGGVHCLQSQEAINAALAAAEPGDIWGIGRRYARMLERHGVSTALEFVRLSSGWVRQHMTVLGWATQQELRGIPCFGLEHQPPPRRSMIHSRSFGRKIGDLSELLHAVAHYAVRLGERLRGHRLHAGHLRLFLRPPQSLRERQPGRSDGCSMDFRSSDGRILARTAKSLLLGLHRPGDIWRKAGLVALDLRSEKQFQQNLFQAPPDPGVMQAMDELNSRFGRGCIRLAAEGVPDARWKMQQSRRSPRYTTRWDELRHIDIDGAWRKR
jgi:DNA polymerase V